MRNLDWLSQEKLFIHDATYAKNSVIVQTNKAAMLLMKGDLEGGRSVMEEADKIYPKYPILINNWGMYFLRKGELDKAKDKFEECLRISPNNNLCNSNLVLLK